MPKPTFFNLPEAKRDRIVQAAIDVFAAHPYAEATLDSIVAKAGVSKGSMYQYFDGKSDLYVWLLTAHMGEKKLAHIAAHPAPEGASIWSELSAAFLAGVAFSQAEPRLRQLASRFLRDSHSEPAIAEVKATNHAAGHAWLLQLLERGVAQGDVRADANLPMLATLLQHTLGEGMLEHLAHRLGMPLAALHEAPEAIGALTHEDLRELIASVLALIQQGATPASEGSP